MANTAAFAKRVCGIITMKDYEIFEYLYVGDLLKGLFSNADYGNYAFIVHNEDVDENGVPESPHIHFYVECMTRKRISTIIGEIAKYCDVDSRAVTCSPCKSEVSTLQYFIHANDPNKVQYDRGRIVHNYEGNALDLILDSTPDGVTPAQLYDIVMECHGINSRIMTVLGLKVYQKFRWCIVDLQREIFGLHMPMNVRKNPEKKTPS